MLTKLQKMPLLSISKFGGISLGRLWPAVNFGTGKRLLMPNNARPENREVLRAQILSVQRRPTFCRRALRTNGKTNPVERRQSSFVERTERYLSYIRCLAPPTPVPENMIPAARPRRSENHSGKSLITGM